MPWPVSSTVPSSLPGTRTSGNSGVVLVVRLDDAEQPQHAGVGDGDELFRIAEGREPGPAAQPPVRHGHRLDPQPRLRLRRGGGVGFGGSRRKVRQQRAVQAVRLAQHQVAGHRRVFLRRQRIGSLRSEPASWSVYRIAWHSVLAHVEDVDARFVAGEVDLLALAEGVRTTSVPPTDRDWPSLYRPRSLPPAQLDLVDLAVEGGNKDRGIDDDRPTQAGGPETPRPQG